MKLVRLDLRRAVLPVAPPDGLQPSGRAMLRMSKIALGEFMRYVRLDLRRAILPVALRAMLRMSKIVPDDFVNH